MQNGFNLMWRAISALKMLVLVVCVGTVAAVYALLQGKNSKQGEHEQKHEIAQGNEIVHAQLICAVDYTFSQSYLIFLVTLHFSRLLL